MSIIQVDDRDSNLFTTGVWFDADANDQAYWSTLSFTGAQGASKVARFVGTSITVYGALQPDKGTPNNPLVLHFSIDGGPPFVYAPGSIDVFGYATYFTSPKLSMGEHVLTMTAAASRVLCLLDYMAIQADSGQPQILKSDGSSVPRVNVPVPVPQSSSSSSRITTTPTQQQNTPQPTPTTAPASSSSSSSPTSSRSDSDTDIDTPSSTRSPSTSPPFSIRSSAQSSQTNHNAPSDTLFSPGVIQPTTINGNSDSAQLQGSSSKSQQALIIGLVVSILGLLVLVCTLLWVLRKRKQRGALAGARDRGSVDQEMVEERASSRRSDVDPFMMAPPLSSLGSGFNVNSNSGSHLASGLGLGGDGFGSKSGAGMDRDRNSRDSTSGGDVNSSGGDSPPRYTPMSGSEVSTGMQSLLPVVGSEKRG